MQNLVVLIEPSEDADEVSLKAEYMILNRFCIDKNAAFELSGVNYLKKSKKNDIKTGESKLLYYKFRVQRKQKGKGYSFL